MTIRSVLIANRGEIAIRIATAAAELGIRSVSVYTKDDTNSLHIQRSDESIALNGQGPKGYLDIDDLLRCAEERSCDAIHPGYGFLSENPMFAERCAESGLTFVGPSPRVLRTFGNKGGAKELARSCGVPIVDGSDGPSTPEEAKALLHAFGSPILLKSVFGGGGRGIRLVSHSDAVDNAFELARLEAMASFGSGELYVERFLSAVRHIEVQVAGDNSGEVIAVGDRDCSLQRRHQKIIEFAPAPNLGRQHREVLHAAAIRMAQNAQLDNLATIEFLVNVDGDPSQFAFLEANPRIQVEHTVTEQAADVDLVSAQLVLASGSSLGEAHLFGSAADFAEAGGALEVRVVVDAARFQDDTHISDTTVTVFEMPTGPGIRVDTCGHVGYKPNPSFDPLLAKIIVRTRHGGHRELTRSALRALDQVRIEGVSTNLPLLKRLLEHPTVAGGSPDTGFVDRTFSEPFTIDARPADDSVVDAIGIDEDVTAVLSPADGIVVALGVTAGGSAARGQLIAIVESMKMEYVAESPLDGVVSDIYVVPGQSVARGDLLATVLREDSETEDIFGADPDGAGSPHADLLEVVRRHEVTLDIARETAVTRRWASGRRSARENIADLCDPGSFREYGQLVVAAQRQRHSLEELMDISPADGIVTGVGSVNASLFHKDVMTQCVVMTYDYTVFAGTQGTRGHLKSDRMFELAANLGLPIILFAEGGGGRPNDTEGGSGEVVKTFSLFAALSGRVPLVGIGSGRCFAGNAVLLGCCDVIIATPESTIGMGGPAMVEGGGLGRVRPEEIGPFSVHIANGVIDIAATDDADAVLKAKQYLSYFQGSLSSWECGDQTELRNIIPHHRRRVYDIRKAIATLADVGSVLELRSGFGLGMVTALIRLEGRPVGVVANNPHHNGGAIDAAAADKASRFLQLCDAFGIPILFLCDTPGIMVGPHAESEALVRHASRLFLVGASLRVPLMTVVLRKSFGLGALAMAGGGNKMPLFHVAWPTGEFGGMGIEGAVRLGYRKELDSIADPMVRRQRFEELVAEWQEKGAALEMASKFVIDDVIDPAETRHWIADILTTAPPADPPAGRRRQMIDAW